MMIPGFERNGHAPSVMTAPSSSSSGANKPIQKPFCTDETCSDGKFRGQVWASPFAQGTPPVKLHENEQTAPPEVRSTYE